MVSTRLNRSFDAVSSSPLPAATPVSPSSSSSSLSSGVSSSTTERREYAATVMRDRAEGYESYQDMVRAKRRRNQELLERSGLLGRLKEELVATTTKKKAASGLRPSSVVAAAPRRKSNRLAGKEADDVVVEREAGRRFVFSNAEAEAEPEPPLFYNGRVNDGSDLSVREAVEGAGPKWAREGSVAAAESFVAGLAAASFDDDDDDEPVADDVEEEPLSAKVVPERVYAVACHPDPGRVIACAGDKRGHVGLWDVDADRDGDDPVVHLFRPHADAVTSLEWDPDGASLTSVSYDGTVRRLVPERAAFVEHFATYDDSKSFHGRPGRGADDGGWTQHGRVDHRNRDCLFASTSTGRVLHVDARAGKITFHARLSDKKINTVDLHREGRALATAGLDGTIRLWDVRTLSSSSSKPAPLVSMPSVGRSVNSAFFAPSGDDLLSTDMADRIRIAVRPHLSNKRAPDVVSFPHDNHTGRWLSTFMARWHPARGDDLFVVGSMRRPRVVETYHRSSSSTSTPTRRDITGLTAVASRCCFHPSPRRLVVVGGNSSGKVTVAEARSDERRSEPS